MYQSLYRKYRPNTFKSIAGQKSIVKILKNSILNNKISHAYLFSGPRGTGKTSIAKILAKTVNCLNIDNGESCGNCDNCLEINSGTAVDIIEIDAASNNGVDEIRELRNNIKLSCSSLKYKVYIIDEVHMLSTGAFNALLKTLEEPPKHVIFILATTDPQKVPSTIISRCQCYNFEQISINDIVDNLRVIAEKEKILVSDEVLSKIAGVSNGGMRDALGLLEKVSLYGSNISLSDFDELCGFVTDDDINVFVSALFDSDLSKVIAIINDKYLSGINLITFFNQVIDNLRHNLVDNVENIDLVQKYVRYIKVVNEVCNFVKTSTNPRSVAIALIVNEILKDVNNLNIAIENNVINNKDENIKKESFVKDKKEKKNVVENKNIDNNISSTCIINNEVIINNTFATASKQKLLDFKNRWSILNEYVLDNNYGSSVSFLLDAEICAVGDKNIILSFDYDSMVNRAIDMYETLNETVTHLLKEKIYIAFISKEKWLEEKNNYIKKIKEGYDYVIIDENPIKRVKNKKSGSKYSGDADIIFGEDIVEYE